MKTKLNNKGFSLVELLIALAVSAVVMATILALWAYAANRMAETNQRVILQDEAKDVMNHITNVVQEGSSAEWKKDGGVSYLVVKNDSDGVPSNRKETVYWHIGKKMYFASTDVVSVDSLSADDTHLLGENIEEFKCEIIKNDESKTKYIKVSIDMDSGDMATMGCSDNIYLRNQ